MTATGFALHEVELPALSVERLRPVLTEQGWARLRDTVDRGLGVIGDRRVWNVNSTAAGGGVAEMLRSLLAYARGAGVDARWVVIGGDDDFFRVTKRLHNRLHGAAGDGGPLGEEEHRVYERTLAAAGAALADRVERGDVVILHDPQTAGLVDAAREAVAKVVWRSHVGAETPNERVAEAWAFLKPYVARADGFVFSRHCYEPPDLDGDRTAFIPPSIDALSPKNEPLDQRTVRAILARTGLVTDAAAADWPATFERPDGTRTSVERPCDVLQAGPPPAPDVPLVVQVSRWYRLKDHAGVLEGFARHVAPGTGAHLLLAGPSARSVADDPEGGEVLDEIEAAWRDLPPDLRARVQVACLPMADLDENAAIVNAIQRHATVIVQKSLQEGFGLTVTEAMWKGRPVVASDVGGIRDQVVDGESGVLLEDPRDLAAFGAAVSGLLADELGRRRMGEAAHVRVRDHFLHDRHFEQYVELLGRLLR